MAETDERYQSRLAIRMSQGDATLIARAAHAARESIHDFVTAAAVDCARRVLKRGADARLAGMQDALAKAKRKG
jgi:uncharacterized protein (DUF1778 family)